MRIYTPADERIAKFNRVMAHKSTQAHWSKELTRLCSQRFKLSAIRHKSRYDGYANVFAFCDVAGRITVTVDVHAGRDQTIVRISSSVHTPWGEERGADGLALPVEDVAIVGQPQTLLASVVSLPHTARICVDCEGWLRDQAAVDLAKMLAEADALAAAIRGHLESPDTQSLSMALLAAVRANNREHCRKASDWLDRVRKLAERQELSLAG